MRILGALLLFTVCRVSADATDELNTRYAGQVHAFVSAWLKASPTVGPQPIDNTSIPRWAGWDDESVGTLRAMLTQPAPVVHHPWSGCKPSPLW